MVKESIHKSLSRIIALVADLSVEWGVSDTYFLAGQGDADQARYSGLSLVQTAVRDMPTKPLGLQPSG